MLISLSENMGNIQACYQDYGCYSSHTHIAI